MRVLIIGSGGREHAIAWALSHESPCITSVCAPGNPGIASIAPCLACPPLDLEAMADLAEQNAVDLTIVGPEAPLAAGITDIFARRGLRVFGPTGAAALLESSKVFMKTLCHRYGIPTAEFRSFDDAGDAAAYIRKTRRPLVVKADGLAGGKGVVVAADLDEAVDAIEAMMVDRRFGEAGARVVVEEFLTGDEVSVFALCDGTAVVPLMPVQDHKRVGEGDAGPNTGGMGAYAPVRSCRPEVVDRITDEVLEPVLWAMAQEGRPYRGVLFAGLMLTADGPRVLEFNVRLGDPETQALVPLWDSSLLDAVDAVLAGRVHSFAPRWRAASAVCVVLCADGYPATPRTGNSIFGIREAEAEEGVLVFHAGTALHDGQLTTAGGRVLNVVGTGGTLAQARGRAYRAVEKIEYAGKVFRRDIGARAVRGAEADRRTAPEPDVRV